MSDALRSASVVLPNGQSVTASASNNPDLFWALRGGGGGNFGVVTSLTFATFPTSDADVVNLTFPPERSEEHTSELQSRGHLVRRPLLAKQTAYRPTPPLVPR